MIISIRPGVPADQVKKRLVALGLWVRRLDDASNPEDVASQFLVEGHSRPTSVEEVKTVEGVDRVYATPSSHPRLDEQPRTIDIGSHAIGVDAPFAAVFGPCSLDSEARIRWIAERTRRAGARFLRGGAFKPRTSPYAFQGAGEEALRWMRRAAQDQGMAVVTECLSEDHVELVAEYADLIQVGSRNMHNYALLKRVATAGKPVLLKRGMAATLEEWLLAGEYLRVHGSPGVVFCERGVRGFDGTTRNLLDLASVAQLAQMGLAVIVDPSHATGRRDLVPALARASRAIGAHGVMVETHDDPGEALSDGPQALGPAMAEALIRELVGADG